MELFCNLRKGNLEIDLNQNELLEMFRGFYSWFLSIKDDPYYMNFIEERCKSSLERIGQDPKSLTRTKWINTEELEVYTNNELFGVFNWINNTFTGEV